jgi:hypothetical protein
LLEERQGHARFRFGFLRTCPQTHRKWTHFFQDSQAETNDLGGRAQADFGGAESTVGEGEERRVSVFDGLSSGARFFGRSPR